MASTTFSGPVRFGEVTGNVTTETVAFVPGRRVVYLDQTAPLKTLTIPAKAVVTNLGFYPTSAFTGTDPVSAMNITFRNGTLIHGVVTASAATRYHETNVVSAAGYDTGGTMTVTLSALSTTVFTGGGGRAYVDYIVTE